MLRWVQFSIPMMIKIPAEHQPLCVLGLLILTCLVVYLQTTHHRSSTYYLRQFPSSSPLFQELPAEQVDWSPASGSY